MKKSVANAINEELIRAGRIISAAQKKLHGTSDVKDEAKVLVVSGKPARKKPARKKPARKKPAAKKGTAKKGTAKKGTAKKGKRKGGKRKFSPAQIAAQKKFAAMARARAKG